MDPTRKYFEALAPIYQELASQYKPNVQLQNELPYVEHEVRNVLDLGCGTGPTLAALFERFPRARATAVDFSNAMVDQAQSEFADVQFHCADVCDFVERSDEKYDLIASIGVLEFVPDLPQFLPLVLRRLSKPGTLIMTYEPLIAGSDVQSEAVHYVSGGALTVDEHFPIYHWQPDVIETALRGAGARVDASRLYIGYVRRGHPIVYHFLRATV